ncbi:PREDICTED: putative cyclin-D6-1 isoform X2 [Lupinus angustifolius]|uniref:putative cyclin-D6-1 isoform X2 n=1 Tax=Lupinus angustifolius TaxID=3871 RepID=UPI00092F315F|nr:PREDICTED: putative cyclin-D6-1 isoform X2 [Lupinus angustifolius]
MEFHLENPLQNFHDFHCGISCLFLIESDHIPSQHYSHTLNARDLDIFIRRKVVSIISQLCCNLDPLLSYLAVNYLDRFLAKQGILNPKPWSLRLLAISCFSLAAKMMCAEDLATNVQALLEQSDGDFIFETHTIQRMEAIILGALQWRMRSITPFSFITFFINLFTLKDQPMRQILNDRVAEIILKSQHIKLLEFKPSIIAASALLCASHELFPFHYPSFFRAISDCSYVNKESVVQCYSLILDIAAEEDCVSVFNAVSSSITPVNVLDHHFPSSESDQINGITVTASTLRQQDNQDHKRRKITGYGNNQTVHISRIKQC